MSKQWIRQTGGELDITKSVPLEHIWAYANELHGAEARGEIKHVVFIHETRHDEYCARQYLRVCFSVLETDEEEAERIRLEDQARLAQERPKKEAADLDAKERAEYARLKAKFGDEK